MKKFILLAYVALITPAFAINIDGVWSTPEGCAWLRKAANNDLSDPPLNLDQFSYLRSEGVEGYDWSCIFGETINHDNQTSEVKSICETEGEKHNETLYISFENNKWVVKIYDPETSAYAFEEYTEQCK